jgi:K+-transporting ATPase ATPase C chain
MWSYLAPAFRLTIVLTVLTGGLYPAAVTAVSAAVHPAGPRSLLTRDGCRGLGADRQNFTRPNFHPRPSAASHDVVVDGSNFARRTRSSSTG